MGQDELTAPTAADIERLAYGSFEDLPEVFRTPAQQIVLRVEDFPDEALLSDLGINDPFELTGLYDGIPLTQKSVSDQPEQPDMIWLFRRSILDEWVTRGNVTLAELVAHIVVHELAHHFGWSDEDIAKIDEWWT